MSFFKKEERMDLNAFKQRAIQLSLKKMFNGPYFNICTIDTCLSVAGAIPPKEIYDALATLHCMDWSEMEPKFRNEVFIQTLELFTHIGFDLNKVDTLELFADKQTGKNVYKLLSSEQE